MSRSFRLLVRHFFLQFFGVDTGTDSRPGVGVVLGILMVPGALMSLVLLGKYSSLVRWFKGAFLFDPDIASLPDKYTFVAFSMTVTGIVAVLRWDTLFPDRRDFVNLAPLPVDLRLMLAARVVALAGFVLLFVVDVNLISTLAFPLIVLEDHGTVMQVLRFVWSHAVAMLAAGLWTFCAFLALTGCLMTILPYGVFRRTKRYVQFGCVLVLLMLFLSASEVGQQVMRLRLSDPNWTQYLPSAWFVGLYQQVQGKGTGLFPLMARYAGSGLLLTAIAAAVFYGLSYKVYFLRLAETTDTPVSAVPVPKWLVALTGRMRWLSSADRASVRFILYTLARSDRHAGALAATLAPGVALAVGSIATMQSGYNVPVGAMSASLLIIYSLLTGLRLSFGIPLELRAAWMFRFHATETIHPQGAVRTALWLFLLPVTIVFAILFGVATGPAVGLWHLLYCLSVSVLLIEYLSSGFGAIPFTCTWLPGGDNPVLGVAIWVAGLTLFGHLLGFLEAFLLIAPWRFGVFWAFLVAAFFGLRQLQDTPETLAWSDTRGNLELLRIAE